MKQSSELKFSSDPRIFEAVGKLLAFANARGIGGLAR